MKIFTTLTTEMMGSIIFVLVLATRMLFPETEEFWLALATAISLFLSIHIRSYLTKLKERKAVA